MTHSLSASKLPQKLYLQLVSGITVFDHSIIIIYS